jgi:ubiquinone/menaquinone biosynthesis methyltransferase
MGTLRSTVATPVTKGRYVRRLFATIADRYDFITAFLSCGRDRRWKRRVAELAAFTSGERALDLACGTGDIAFALAGIPATRVVGLDITRRMVELARAKQAVPNGRPQQRNDVCFLVGDMSALPFPDASFDLLTTGYGIRNVPDIGVALREAARVLRPGGRIVSLDFNRPDNALVRVAYLGYLSAVGSVLGFALHRDPDVYRYIPESIRIYPGAGGVSRLMREYGFADAGYEPVFGGLMAINWGRR